MMITFKAKGGTEFFYNPELPGEIWILAPEWPHLEIGHTFLWKKGVPHELAVTTVIPAADLLEFAKEAEKKQGG